MRLKYDVIFEMLFRSCYLNRDGIIVQQQLKNGHVVARKQNKGSQFRCCSTTYNKTIKELILRFDDALLAKL